MVKRRTTNIDVLYGLEPVLEPGREAGSDALERFVERACPYCDEQYGVTVDLSAGPQTYVEDCQVCCQPISTSIVVGENGEFLRLEVQRLE